MVVTDAITALRNKIFERAGKTGLVDATQDRIFLKEANRDIWKAAVRMRPTLFEILTGTLTLAPTGLAFTTIDATDGVYGIGSVERLVGGDWVPVYPIDSKDRFVLDPGPRVASVGLVPYYFYDRAEILLFAPTPAANLSVRVSYVPNLTDPADGAQLLDGRLPMHHDLVVTHAAQLCMSKDEELRNAWDDEYALQYNMLSVALSESQGMQTRRIRAMTPF